MPRKSYANASNMLKMCRVCLTQSSTKMFDLMDDIIIDECIMQSTILEVLEKVVSVKILLDNDFPECICPMCVSILKMSFKFITQFEDTQKKLSKNYNKETCIWATKEFQEESVLSEGKNNAPVEIIFGTNKFDLKDILVVEDVPKEQNNFDGFLNNLGREVSASFANQSQRDKQKLKPNGIDEITIYMNDHENGIMPVKELKIDNDSNIIDYIVVEKEGPVDRESIEDIEYIELESLEDDYIQSWMTIGNHSEESEKDKENVTDREPQNQKIFEVRKHKKSNITETFCKGITLMAPDIVDKSKDQQTDSVAEIKSKDVIIMSPENITVKTNVQDLDEFEKEVRFPCDICRKIFPNKKSLATHKKRHLPSQRHYTCDVCGYKNKTRSGYIHHQNKHKGKHFVCDICDKKYYTKAVLKVHMASHVNKRQHLCQVCGNGFNYANALVYHMRLHTGEKNYDCRYCGEKFRMPNGLKRHERTHTGERPYECRFCDKAFSSKGEVQCHENIHTGYRPYHCKYCRKGFTKTHNLKLHLLQHDGPHKCDICFKSFIEMAILSMHYKIAHKDVQDTVEEGEILDEIVEEEVEMEVMEGEEVEDEYII